jgi:hypothetical protein
MNRVIADAQSQLTNTLPFRLSRIKIAASVLLPLLFATLWTLGALLKRTQKPNDVVLGL